MKKKARKNNVFPITNFDISVTEIYNYAIKTNKFTKFIK